MGDGMATFGRSLTRTADIVIRGALALRRDAPGAIPYPQPEPETLNRQELLQMQQHFNRRFHEWQAANAATRHDRLPEAYEEFIEAFREETSDEELFSNDMTRQAFHFWTEEAFAKGRVPLVEQAVDAMRRQNAALYDANLESALTHRDPAALFSAIDAAVEDRTLTPEEAQNALDDGLYRMNRAQIHDQLMEYGAENGWDAAVAQLALIEPEDVSYVSGMDADGNPVYRSISREDLSSIQDEVRQELQRARAEQTYRINETDRIWDERATTLFTDRSMPDLLAFKAWLEGVNPQTGEQMPDDQNPRHGMKSSTWRTWYNMVNSAIAREERELTAAEEVALDGQRAEALINLYRMNERDEDPKMVKEFIFQTTEAGIFDVDEARTLISFTDAQNQNPILQGIRREFDYLERLHEVTPAQRSRAEDAFLRWFNNEAVQLQGEEWAYNVDRTKPEDMARIARNIFYSAMDRELRDDKRSVYNISLESIQPSLSDAPVLRRDTHHIDDAEEVLHGVQTGQYLGWQSMPERKQFQLEALWSGHARMFREMSGVEPINSVQLDPRGTPILQGRDTAGRVRYFRFYLPMDDEGRVIRGQMNEELQIWDNEAQLWRPIESMTRATREGWIPFRVSEGPGYTP